MITESDLPLSWSHPRSKTGPSKIQGKGRFVTNDLPAGEIVCVSGGYVLTKEEILKLEFETIGQHSLALSSDVFLCNPRTKPDDRILLNHSCEPNVFVEGQIVFKALTPIRKGQELLIDYGTLVDEDAVLIRNCQCGSLSCRKQITGRDWKKPMLQKKYDGLFASHIQSMIDSEKL
jgi:SET domain-containing protein